MSLAKKIKDSKLYSKFDEIDGSHTLKSIVPQGYVDYPARIRQGGSVKYFNYDLAEEMGLIPLSHNSEMTAELEAKILETFSIQIINEFDEINERKFPEEEMKSGKYMATRYLQLQHDSKKGKTSGDGRSIWNGEVKHKGSTWDISSCGTGATCLSPATSKFNKFFETGDPTISYGCGYAEVDEGLATSLMSKVFKANGLVTEQTLGVIEFKNNISINIRAHKNLIRPSHIFLYLKQDDLESLTNIVDYYIDQQVLSGEWSDCPKNIRRYDYFLKKVCDVFSKTVAIFEDEYIFCWLDWDGDNILMDGGIIDYGSIRQFGIFHHEYRYDDVERFSTNILEQKKKAKNIVQSFAQAIDYIKTKDKKSLSSFSNDSLLNRFEATFEEQKSINILHKIGFTEKKIKHVLKRYQSDVIEFRKAFSYFEKTNSKVGVFKIPDGITCDAVFNMRTFLREYPQLLMTYGEKIGDNDFIELVKSQYARSDDLDMNSYRKQKISDLQDIYIFLMTKTAQLFQVGLDDLQLEVAERSQVINKSNRITGDAVTHIVAKIASSKLSEKKIHKLISDITASQNLLPTKKVQFSTKHPGKLLSEIFEIINDNREGL
jgi:hypothetical protein